MSSPDLTGGSHQITVIAKIPSLRGSILNSSEVLGAAAPKGLGRSPYKICEQWGKPHSLAMTRILKFLSLVSSPDLIGGSHHNKSRIPKTKNTPKNADKA